MSNKSVFLLVEGEDFSALEFSKRHNIKDFYQKMISEGVKKKIINDDDYYAEVEIVEFGEVDDKFIDFVKNVLCDYDGLKATDLFKVS
jgi:hypothetical protein